VDETVVLELSLLVLTVVELTLVADSVVLELSLAVVSESVLSVVELPVVEEAVVLELSLVVLTVCELTLLELSLVVVLVCVCVVLVVVVVVVLVDVAISRVGSDTSTSTSSISVPSTAVALPLLTASWNFAATASSSASASMLNEAPAVTKTTSVDPFDWHPVPFVSVPFVSVALVPLVKLAQWSVPFVTWLVVAVVLDSSSAIWIVSARPEAAAVSCPSAVPFEVFELFAAVSRRSRRAPVCTETILMREGSIWRSVAKLSMKLAPSNSCTETETVRDSCTT